MVYEIGHQAYDFLNKVGEGLFQICGILNLVNISDIYALFFIIVVITNAVAATVIVFYERRSPQVAAAWILLLFFLPVLGFFVYIFFGRHLYGKYKFGKKTSIDKKFEFLSLHQRKLLDKTNAELSDVGKMFKPTVNLLLNQDKAVYFENNEVKAYITGNDVFFSMKKALWSAKESIHMEYYIIRDDTLGREIMDILTKKAAEGVEVRVLFDAMGVHKIKSSFYKNLKNAGGEIRILFPLLIPYINTRINYRNHRKILVVDGKTAFLGGFNIGVEYLGKGPLGYWRDTHIRIRGGAVGSLQNRFIMDWNYAAERNGIKDDQKYIPSEIFEKSFGNTAVQIASSGPDSSETAIYSGFISLIGHAKKSIYIQTPYFVPDQTIFETLRVACQSGIDVRITIPCKPDHPFVYWATYSYLGDLIKLGAKGYTYERGFIHSKTAVIDEAVVTIGTANWDIRSFKLNFETNAFIYDKSFGEKMKDIMLKEMENDCREITIEEYNQRSLKIKIKEGISRMMSNLL